MTRAELLAALVAARWPAELREVLAKTSVYNADHPGDLEVRQTAEGAARLLDAFDEGLLEDLSVRP